VLECPEGIYFDNGGGFWNYSEGFVLFGASEPFAQLSPDSLLLYAHLKRNIVFLKIKRDVLHELYACAVDKVQDVLLTSSYYDTSLVKQAFDLDDRPEIVFEFNILRGQWIAVSQAPIHVQYPSCVTEVMEMMEELLEDVTFEDLHGWSKKFQSNVA
jgi:hypothetical protein